MLTDGIKFLDESIASNFIIESGATLPTTGNNKGELFFLDNVGLHVYSGTEWSPVGSGGGGSATPGGADTQVQFNDSGVFAGNAAFTFNKLTGAVSATSFSGTGSALTALNTSNITLGTVNTARLGSGTANNTTFLRGDGTWAPASASTVNLANTQVGYGNTSGVLTSSDNFIFTTASNTLQLGRDGSRPVTVRARTATTGAPAAGNPDLNLTAGNGLKNVANSGSVRISAGSATTTADGIITFTTGVNGTFGERVRIAGSGAIGFGGANFGTTGQVLTSAGNNAVPTWSSPVAGANTQVQFNASGLPGASANFTWNNGTNTLSATNLSSTGTATIATLNVSTGVSVSLLPTTNGTLNLGSASFRWATVFAATGTINTSDANLKQDISVLSAAELAVAQTLKTLIRKFRFKDAVALKGNDARIHVGVIAQDVRDAFLAQNLNPEMYGVFCSDTWVDEDGVSHTQLGVRYDELFAFIIAALN